MKCIKCGQELMEGAAFCPYCGAKQAPEAAGNDGPIYQADVKGMRTAGKLSVYRDRTEFTTSSVQKRIYNYSALVGVRKKLGMGTVLGVGLDHIEFITEDGSTEACPVSRKDVHEAFLRIQEAIAPYLVQRQQRLLAQGIRYSMVSSVGLTGNGILNISDQYAELTTKSGQGKTVSFRDVKSVRGGAGTLEFSLVDGSAQTFNVDKEQQEEILAFVQAAVAPYIAERKAALLAQGIYFSSLSSNGSAAGTLNIYEDRAEFVPKSGQPQAVPFQAVRAVSLYSENLELFLTDGTSRSFSLERDLQNQVLAFVQNGIQPYVLLRTEGFDLSFGLDEKIEVNEGRGVFHILRQNGCEISEEYPLDDLIRCERIEFIAPKSALGLLAGAAKAVGVQDKLGSPDAENIIRYLGVGLTLRSEEASPAPVRFGDFSLGMSRTNKKYEQYLAEAARFMEYLESRCPACELVLPAIPEPEPEPEPELVEPEPQPEIPAPVPTPAVVHNTPSEMEQLGITKYIEGVSNFISGCATPMTIAVQGSWGSGKSSVMNMLADSLSGDRGDTLVWFNPRLLLQAKSEDPLPILLGKALIRQLSGAEGSVSKDSAVKIAKGMVGLLTGIIVSDSSVGQTLVEGLFKDGSAIPPEKLVEVFSQLVEKKAGGPDGKVIILINELDRLPPAQVVELLEALRNFFDCPGCVFVTAIDYSLFQRGVKETPTLALSPAQEKALFDELFQMSFRVPVSGQQIRGYVHDKLERMGISVTDQAELDRYTALLQRSVGMEPKNMDRLFNSFLLLKSMADQELCEDPAQRQMLFALLCMQTRFYPVYEQLKARKDRLTPALLSGLGTDAWEVTAACALTEEEQSSFSAFAQTLLEIMDTEDGAGISPTVCDKFARVLEFSGITSR